MKKVTLKNSVEGKAVRVSKSEVHTYFLRGYKLTAKKVVKRFIKMENKLTRNFKHLTSIGISVIEGSKIPTRPQDLLKVSGTTTYYMQKTTDFVNRFGINEALQSLPFLEREDATKEIRIGGRYESVFLNNVFPQFTRRTIGYKL